MADNPSWKTAERRFDLAHRAAEGHFPGNPLIPGAVLLDEIRTAIGETMGGLRMAKFLTPVRPGDRLLVRWAMSGTTEVKFEALLNGDRLAVSGVFTLKKDES